MASSPRPAPPTPAPLPAGAATPENKAPRGYPSEPERVAASITRGLRAREYTVGQHLVEAEITAKLGVSRSTVREALKLLASRGVVDIVPHRGAMIRGLGLAEAGDLLDVLEVLIGLAARRAAEKIGEGENRAHFLAAARPLVAPEAASELAQVLEERARFYQAMLDMAGSEDLERAMPTWRAHLLRNQFFRFVSKSDLRAMVSEYRQIVQAVVAGDPVKAEQQARRHIRKTRDRTLPHLR